MNASMQIAIDNLKCGGCANTIRKALATIDGVGEVQVDHDQACVRVDADDALRPRIVAELARLGYPETGSVQGLAAGVATAKSFVSCAVGRIGADTTS